MKLIDYLCVPYIVAASSEDDGAGDWVRIAECPELSGCRVSAPSIVQAVDDLSRRRITLITELLRSGTPPPVPRPPLTCIDLERELRRLGLFDELSSILDLSGDDIHRSMSEKKGSS